MMIEGGDRMPANESPPGPERVAIYARVSTDEQAERQTIAGQLDACREYCLAKGYEIVAEFLDDGISGAVPFDERPEGKRLLEVTQDRLFSKVIVYCVDRLGRDVVEGSLARKEFEHRGAPLEFVLHTFDGTPEGRLAFNIFLSFAEYERAAIRRRTMLGHLRRVKGGKYLASRPPFGYTYNQEAGQLEPHPENAAVVREIFQWARGGAGLKTIVSRLEEKGIPPPSSGYPKRRSNWGWHFTTVHKILTAPRYTGRNTYGGEPMTCPAIVDEETFAAVQHGLKRRKADSSRNTKHPYLLQHLVYCRHCGGRYMARTAAQKSGPVTIYACRQRAVYGLKAGHAGIHWRWRGNELEEPVKRHILWAWADPGHILREAQVYAEKIGRDALEREDREAALRARLDRLAQEELRVLEWARKGHISETQMLQQLGVVRTERRGMEDELEQQAAARIGRAEVPPHIVLGLEFVRLMGPIRKLLPEIDEIDEHDVWTADALDRLAELPAGPVSIDEVLRESIQALVERIWVEDDGSITIEGVIPGIDPPPQGAIESPSSR
jgi:site-specific DNA recombinase